MRIARIDQRGEARAHFNTLQAHADVAFQEATAIEVPAGNVANWPALVDPVGERAHHIAGICGSILDDLGHFVDQEAAARPAHRQRAT